MVKVGEGGEKKSWRFGEEGREGSERRTTV